MLIELRIRDYAVIDTLALELEPGLNVLTGETGAGKSIVVGALSLLLGERATADVVRMSAPKAVVEGVFDIRGRPELLRRLEELGVEAPDGLLILKREVAAEGRNRAWVNASPATATVVGELGRALVDLHGQHEHQTLLHASEQRAILDAFADAGELAAAVAALHRELVRLRAERVEREHRHGQLLGRADTLRFQVGEIEGARPDPHEEVALEDEARRLQHSEELVRGATRVHEALYAGDDAIADRLADLQRVLEQLARVDPSLAEAAALLEGAYFSIKEVGVQVGDYASGLEHDPGRLEEIRHRQDLIFRLKRKYGPELMDVIETGRRLRHELDALDTADVELDALRRHIEDGQRRIEERAAALSAARRKAAQRLAAWVKRMLPELGMPGAAFEVALEPLPEIGAYGAESVEFRVAVNPGFEPRAVARVASGGELSRIMLVLKTILADVDRVPTLVFDEIDVGIGGRVALHVAEKLHEVATSHQVFVITHLPQLAARADHHLYVEKGEREGVAAATVAELAGEERVREIARMLGGDSESATSLEHARELLTSAGATRG
ncbi:MAG: DNA repair protein RecN [Gemmatimonadetes bacterium]|nr:DNA repair protein RecN [Gemmatimonadota bacterium]